MCVLFPGVGVYSKPNHLLAVAKKLNGVMAAIHSAVLALDLFKRGKASASRWRTFAWGTNDPEKSRGGAQTPEESPEVRSLFVLKKPVFRYNLCALTRRSILEVISMTVRISCAACGAA